MPPILAALALAASLHAPPAAAQDGPYASDPWNAAHRALFERAGADGRTYRADGPFAPLWPASTYLLAEPRHGAALAALERLAAEPVREGPAARALMAADLWALFDWAAEETPRADAPERERRRALLLAAARALRAVAPGAGEVAELPDTLRAACGARALPGAPDPADPRRPFLPADLGLADAGWVLLCDRAPLDASVLAGAHAEAFGGRAWFAVYLRVPPADGDAAAAEGRRARAATLAYLDALARHGGAAWCSGCRSVPSADDRPHLHLDAAAPHPPPGTVVALVARSIAPDAAGGLHATPLATTVQVRAFLEVPADAAAHAGGWPYQAVAELRLDRRRLLAGDVAGALVAVGPEESAPDLLGVHGDPLEERAHPTRLASCAGCHGAVGAASLVVHAGFASGPGTQRDVALVRLPRALGPDREDALARRSVAATRARASWGLLRGLWLAGEAGERAGAGAR